MIKSTVILEIVEDTHCFGRLLGEIAVSGDIYCFDGDLGAGKTTLTQAIAQGLDVPDEYYVTSPSFNIFQEYPGRIPLYHMDFYRLESEHDVIDMGLEEYFYLSGLTVIEWSCKAEDILPENKLSLHLKITNVNKRTVTLNYRDSYWRKRIIQLINRFYEEK